MNGIAPAFARAAAREPAHTPSAPSTPSSWVRDSRHLLLASSLVWVLVVLMIVPEGFQYAALDSIAPSSGGPVSRLLWLALLGGSLFVLLWRITYAWLLLRWLNPFLLLFVMMALASTLWSIEPGVTLRRMIRVLTMMSVALAFVITGWHVLRFQNVLRPILTLVLLGSIIFGLLYPQLAIHQEGSDTLIGSWRGLANHKNGLGNLACIGLIFWAHAGLSRSAHWLAVLGGIAVALVCLILSRSSTSVVATVFTLLFMLMLMRSPQGLRRYMPYLVTLFIMALLTYAMATLDLIPGLDRLLRPISALTGKDTTFTGRTEIWNLLSEHIRLHPLFGTGYGAYWTGGREGTASYAFIAAMNFYPGSAHNGYLEILNDLGMLGLLLLLGYLVYYVAQSLRLLKIERMQAALFLALFLQQALTNLSESRWLNVLSVDFVIMTLATAALARSLLEQRMRHVLRDPMRASPTSTSSAPAPRT